MVTDSQFENVNQVLRFSEVLFKNGENGNSRVQHYINAHKIY